MCILHENKYVISYARPNLLVAVIAQSRRIVCNIIISNAKLRAGVPDYQVYVLCVCMLTSLRGALSI